MIARANTTMTIMRGDAADTYGDESPMGSKVATGILAFLVEKTRKVFTFDDPSPRIVRYHVARVDPRTDIRENDIMMDERTGVHYMVDSFSGNTENPGIQFDIRVDLKIVQ